MDYKNTLDLNTILIGFESYLKIEYQISEKADEIIKEAIRRLENTLSIRIDKSLYEIQIENPLVADSISTLLAQIEEVTKSLALLTLESVFYNKYGETIADIGYLGFPKENLLNALCYLQSVEGYKRRDSFMEVLVASTSNVKMCAMKRLLICLEILEILGIEVSVVVIAYYLYLGGK